MDAQSIVASASEAAFATTEDNEILCCNAAARDLVGLLEDVEVGGRHLGELLQPSDLYGNRLNRDHIPFLEMLHRGEATKPFQFCIRTEAADRQRVAVSVIVVLNPDPAPAHLVYLMRPIFRRRRADEAIDRVLRIPGVRSRVVDRLTNGDAWTAGFHLTVRQLEVIRLLAEGKSNEQIAEDLSLSAHTVGSHLQNIFRELGVHSKAEAVATAFRHGLI
jgi:DNA-binding CsgD family transcriptional regulator